MHADCSTLSPEPRHDKTNKMSVPPAKTQISLGIRPVWSKSSLSAWRKLWSLATHWAHSEDSDQTGRMPRLIWVFAGRTVTLLVLSFRGSLLCFQLYLWNIILRCFLFSKRSTVHRWLNATICQTIKHMKAWYKTDALRIDPILFGRGVRQTFLCQDARIYSAVISVWSCVHNYVFLATKRLLVCLLAWLIDRSIDRLIDWLAKRSFRSRYAHTLVTEQSEGSMDTIASNWLSDWLIDYRAAWRLCCGQTRFRTQWWVLVCWPHSFRDV